MPKKFDFSKIEDQHDFEALPQEEKNEIKFEAQEEAELEEFYSEYNDELLENNFNFWKEHLERQLEQRFNDKSILDQKLNEAKEFTKFCPLTHWMRSTTASYFLNNPTLLSNYRIEHQKEKIEDLQNDFSGLLGNTNSEDQELKRDQFVYSKFGRVWGFSEGQVGWILINPRVLKYKRTIVSLEDPMIIRNSYLPDNTPFELRKSVMMEEHKKQVWSGKRFLELFPDLLTLSYNSPKQYFSKSFAEKIYPEGIIKPKILQPKEGYHPYIDIKEELRLLQNLEIQVPKQIAKEDIMAFCCSKNININGKSIREQIKLISQKAGIPILEFDNNSKDEYISKIAYDYSVKHCQK